MRRDKRKERTEGKSCHVRKEKLKVNEIKRIVENDKESCG